MNLKINSRIPKKSYTITDNYLKQKHVIMYYMIIVDGIKNFVRFKCDYFFHVFNIKFVQKRHNKKIKLKLNEFM